MTNEIKAGDFVYPTTVDAFLNLNPFFEYLQDTGILKPLQIADPEEDDLQPVKVVGVHAYEGCVPGHSQTLLISELNREEGILAILDGDKVRVKHRPLFKKDDRVQLAVHPDINKKEHPGWAEYRLLFYKGAKATVSETSATKESVWYLIEFDELKSMFFSVEETWIEIHDEDVEVVTM